jgi:acetylornithine deacetylase/succinyl-diaminopimelate desuccinylase-like protein
MPPLEEKVAALAALYRPLAARLLREAIRLPADFVDKPIEEGGDPLCGLSNHEGPRMEYLRHAIVEAGAVRRLEDAAFDAYGNLVWVVQDEKDGIAPREKRVVYLDGHADTVQALRPQWRERTRGGIDAYDGVVDLARVDRTVLRGLLGYLPPGDEWEHLLFGRGSADQLAGVVSQIVATKILLELAPEGALRGVVVRSYATAAEEDNDGGGPLYLMSHVLPGAPPELVPDVVILTEGTGDSQKGALGIYRGQRGRMQIEVVVTGRSCHGSMPWEGKNPFEHGGAIVAEAARRYDAREGFLDHPFLGHGTRTASWARLDTPSNCAVPERLTFRFDRRLTVGETPEQAVRDVEALDSVRVARAAGLQVDITVPRYRERTWRGCLADNPQIYRGWLTPEDHPAIQAAVETYRAVVTPHVVEPPGGAQAGALRKDPRVDRWIFSTDGVGFPIPVGEQRITASGAKRWVVSGDVTHPAMFGIGAGLEQNTHRVGECVDLREVQHAIAVLALFPSVFARQQ